MHREFQRFIDLLSVASDRHAFLEAITVTATALDLPCFAYLALTKEPLVISTYPPNWVAHYVRNSYERLDPVILQALQTGAPFGGDRAYPRRTSLQPNMNCLKKRLNLGSDLVSRFRFTMVAAQLLP